MKRNASLALTVGALLLAACSQSLPGGIPSASAPVAQGQNASVASVAVSLTLLAPKAFALQATGTNPVHRWVPADMTKYVVSLQRRTAAAVGQTPATFADVVVNNAPLQLNVPVGPNGTGQANFGALRQGEYYRAKVAAMGKVNGLGNEMQMNAQATADFVDFDFTAANDVASKVDRTLTVKFDDAPFSGTGSISFGTPSPGVYVQPSSGPTASIVCPSGTTLNANTGVCETPSPSPTVTPCPAGFIGIAPNCTPMMINTGPTPCPAGWTGTAPACMPPIVNIP